LIDQSRVVRNSSNNQEVSHPKVVEGGQRVNRNGAGKWGNSGAVRATRKKKDKKNKKVVQM